MAGAVQTQGLTEFRQGAARFEAVAVAKLRLRALSIAEGIRNDTAETYRSRGWQLANEVFVSEDSKAGRFDVFIKPAPPRPENLPLWHEFGTVKMLARPAFQPAVRRARARYVPEMNAAIQEAFDETVGR